MKRFSLALILLMSTGWTHDPPDENNRMHFFACGYILGSRLIDQYSECDDLKEIAARHGFPFP